MNPHASDTNRTPPDEWWRSSGLEEVVVAEVVGASTRSYDVPIRDYTRGYAGDTIPHTTINDRNAGFYGAFFIGSDYFILNEATADRSDTRDSTGRHEITHYLFPNNHMDKVTYEHMTLAMSSTVHSEQPRGIATFQMRDLTYTDRIGYR
jgi:hypothetical protein